MGKNREIKSGSGSWVRTNDPSGYEPEKHNTLT